MSFVADYLAQPHGNATLICGGVPAEVSGM